MILWCLLLYICYCINDLDQSCKLPSLCLPISKVDYSCWSLIIYSWEAASDHHRQTSTFAIFHQYYQHFKQMRVLLLLNDCFSKHLTSLFLVLLAYKPLRIQSERCTHLTFNNTLRICYGWSSILIHWITLILRFLIWLFHLWLFAGIHSLIFWYDCSLQQYLQFDLQSLNWDIQVNSASFLIGYPIAASILTSFLLLIS